MILLIRDLIASLHGDCDNPRSIHLNPSFTSHVDALTSLVTVWAVLEVDVAIGLLNLVELADQSHLLDHDGSVVRNL
jgi:hypothetical protein